MEQLVQSQRSKGLATVLAIGTALPPVCIPHDIYADMYFWITNSEHLTELKDKMTRIFITMINLSPSIPKHISKNIRGCVEEVLKPLGITDLNSLFWIVHPGGPKIFKMVEEKLEMEKEKFNVTKKILTDVGNLSSPTVLFIMNEMRRKSINEGKATTGDGLEFGMLLGFGPGLSIEAILLRSVAI